MTEALEVDAGELDGDSILSALEEGTRVIVRTEFVGETHEVTLRWDGNVFYCDTPTRLHKHENREEMRTCLEKQGYAGE